MSTLSTQSTTIKDYAFANGYLFIFSTGGVDIYKASYIEFVRVGYAALTNVTSGDISDNGIWLGTSDRGVFHCPFGSGDLTSQLRQYYAEAGTSNTIQSNNVSHIAGIGTKLLVCHDVGADYFPAPGVPYSYSDEATTSGAINGTYIAYAVASGLETLALPTSNWDSTDATVLTTGSSPALSSNTVNHLEYGSGNNLFIATGNGVDVYDYTDIITIGSGSIPFVWASSDATQVSGHIIYIDSASDAIIYDITDSEIAETHVGTYTRAWIGDNIDFALYDAELERHAFIDNISPANGGRDIRRDWSLYFEIGDTLHGISSGNIVVKVDGVTVSPTITSLGTGFDSGFSSGFGGEGFKVAFTPASSSGYRKEVKVEISATDNDGTSFTETIYFTTTTASNTQPVGTKAPSVIVYKDLSLTNAEDTYNSVKVNWLDEEISAYYVDEDQAKASAQVKVENGIYHKHNLSVRVCDTDALSNATQDIQEGDIITIDVDGLGLVAQKCEVLSKQRVTAFDRIEYNLNLAYYVVYS